MAVRTYDRLVFDDEPVSEPEMSMAEAQRWLAGWTALTPEFVRGGAYRNKLGELVTWDASEDGSYVLTQTWPGE